MSGLRSSVLAFLVSAALAMSVHVRLLVLTDTARAGEDPPKVPRHDVELTGEYSASNIAAFEAYGGGTSQRRRIADAASSREVRLRSRFHVLNFWAMSVMAIGASIGEPPLVSAAEPCAKPPIVGSAPTYNPPTFALGQYPIHQAGEVFVLHGKDHYFFKNRELAEYYLANPRKFCEMLAKHSLFIITGPRRLKALARMSHMGPVHDEQYGDGYIVIDRSVLNSF
jgi:hypothetical protein